MDITLYRDDLTQVLRSPSWVRPSCSKLTGQDIVLPTTSCSRGAPCARPLMLNDYDVRERELAVLDDRGHRSPHRCRLRGRTIQTEKGDKVEVVPDDESGSIRSWHPGVMNEQKRLSGKI